MAVDIDVNDIGLVLPSEADVVDGNGVEEHEATGREGKLDAARWSVMIFKGDESGTRMRGVANEDAVILDISAAVMLVVRGVLGDWKWPDRSALVLMTVAAGEPSAASSSSLDGHKTPAIGRACFDEFV